MLTSAKSLTARRGKLALSPVGKIATSETRSWSPSKITRPTLGLTAANERLFARLDDAATRPVIWLYGPPGAGKTTLVASWLAARRRALLWYRIDKDDREPSTLFFFLAMANARARKKKSARLPLLTPEFRNGVGAFSQLFFQRLFDRSAPPVLVFDDCHEIDLGSSIHECLAEGMLQVPKGALIVVISRAAPPGPYARLRVNGIVEVIQPELLQLNATEASAIAAVRGAPSGLVEAVLSRSEGWTAGFVLMLEALRTGTALASGDRGIVPELLFDYFASEVLRAMEPREQRLLMTLAVMPNMTAASALSLTGDASAGALLESLARSGYFTLRDDGSEPNYRFHPLFRDFLAASARRSIDAPERARLRLCAAACLEESGQPDAAASLLHEAGAWDLLASLIRKWAGQLERAGRLRTLLAWLDWLPQARIEEDAWLAYWAGAARLPSTPATSLPYFRRAFLAFDRAGDWEGAYLAAAGLEDAILRDGTADFAELDVAIGWLRGLIARNAPFPSVAAELRVSLAMFRALSCRSSDRTEISRWRERALAAATSTGDPEHLAYCHLVIAMRALVDGAFVSAREHLAAARSADSMDSNPFVKSFYFLTLTVARGHLQAPGAVVDSAAQAFALADRTGIRSDLYLQAIWAALDCLRRRDLGEARLWARRIGDTAERTSEPRSVFDYAMDCALDLFAGDHVGALANGRRAVEIASAGHFHYVDALIRMRLAYALLEAGELAELDRQLVAIEAALENSASGSLRLPADLLRSEHLFRRGLHDEGLAVLRFALAKGERDEARLLYLPPALATRVCARALLNEISPSYVRSLIRLNDVPPPSERISQWPWPLRVVSFGEFALFKDGEPLIWSRKTPRRLFTLLKAILVFGAHGAPVERVVDAVWPDQDGDRARQSFDAAVHRLRKLLGDPHFIFAKGGRVGLDPERCWVDAQEFGLGVSMRGATPAQLGGYLALYAGDFLAADEDLACVAPRRRDLRAKFLRSTEALATAHFNRREIDRALEFYQRGLAACPDALTLSHGIARCQHATS